MLRDKSPEEQNSNPEIATQESTVAVAMFAESRMGRFSGDVFSPVDKYVGKFDIRETYKDEGPLYQKMVVGLAGYCKDERESSRADKIGDLVRPGFIAVYGDELAEAEVDYIVANVNQLISTVKLIDNATKFLSVSGGAKNISSDSMFTLMRVMADYDNTTAAPEDKGVALSLAYQSTKSDTGLVDFMLEEIDQGEYDSHVGAELIADSLRADEVKSRQTIQQAAVKRHAMYTAKLLGVTEIDEDFIQKITTKDLIEYWPNEAKQAVAVRKNYISSNIDKNIDFCVRNLEARGLILRKRDKSSIKNQVEVYFKELNKREVASRGAVSILKRRHKIRAQEPKDEVIEIEKPKMKLIPNKIVGPIKNGEETKLKLDDFKELAKDYCKNDANFDKDIEAIFEYLRHVDPKQDIIPGVQKVKDMKVNFNGQVLDLLEYKQSNSNGISASTKLTKDMRIYMVRDGNKFGILKFGRRDHQQQDIRSLTKNNHVS